MNNGLSNSRRKYSEILQSLGLLQNDITKVPSCHSEPFACHSERSEESLPSAQGKLREESQ